MEAVSSSLLEECPNDVLGVIAAHLPLSSWAAIAQLSKRFYDFSNSSSLWKNVTIRIVDHAGQWSRPLQANNIYEVTEVGPIIEGLFVHRREAISQLRFDVFNNNFPVFPLLFELTRKQGVLSNLEKLAVLHYVPLAQIEIDERHAFVPMFPRLTHLSICSGVLLGAESFDALLSHTPRLEFFTCLMEITGNALAQCPRLRVLDFTHSPVSLETLLDAIDDANLSNLQKVLKVVDLDPQFKLAVTKAPVGTVGGLWSTSTSGGLLGGHGGATTPYGSAFGRGGLFGGSAELFGGTASALDFGASWGRTSTGASTTPTFGGFGDYGATTLPNPFGTPTSSASGFDSSSLSTGGFGSSTPFTAFSGFGSATTSTGGFGSASATMGPFGAPSGSLSGSTSSMDGFGSFSPFAGRFGSTTHSTNAVGLGFGESLGLGAAPPVHIETTRTATPDSLEKATSPESEKATPQTEEKRRGQATYKLYLSRETIVPTNNSLKDLKEVKDLVHVDRCVYGGFNALHLALRNRFANEELVRYFVEEMSADVNLRSLPGLNEDEVVVAQHDSAVIHEEFISRYILDCHHYDPWVPSLATVTELSHGLGVRHPFQCRGFVGFAPLHMAIAVGNTDMVSYLVSKGADVNIATVSAGMAARNLDEEMVECLLSLGADASLSDGTGRNALEHALNRSKLSPDDVPYLRRLVRKFASLPCMTRKSTSSAITKQTLLYDLLGKGGIVSALMLTVAIEENVFDLYDDGDEQEIDHSKDATASHFTTSAVMPSYSRSPLHYMIARTSGSTERNPTAADASLYSLLVKYGLGIRAVGPHGRTPLIECIAQGLPLYASILLASGQLTSEDVNSVDEFGLTALHYAVKDPFKNETFSAYWKKCKAGEEWMDDLPVVVGLVDSCANISQPSVKEGITPLLALDVYASALSPFLSYFLEHGASLFESDLHGYTAAQHLVANGLFPLLCPSVPWSIVDGTVVGGPTEQLLSEEDLTRLARLTDSRGVSPLHALMIAACGRSEHLLGLNAIHVVQLDLIKPQSPNQSLLKDLGSGFGSSRRSRLTTHKKPAGFAHAFGPHVALDNKENIATVAFFDKVAADECIGICNGLKVDEEEMLSVKAKPNASVGPDAAPRFLGTLRVFVDHGFDLASRDGYYGYTILHYLARFGAGIGLMEKLLEEFQIDVNVPDADGYTPLHLAIMFDNVIMARTLVNLGADVNVPGKFALTPLHCTSMNLLSLHFGYNDGLRWDNSSGMFESGFGSKLYRSTRSSASKKVSERLLRTKTFFNAVFLEKELGFCSSQPVHKVVYPHWLEAESTEFIWGDLSTAAAAACNSIIHVHLIALFRILVAKGASLSAVDELENLSPAVMLCMLCSGSAVERSGYSTIPICSSTSIANRSAFFELAKEILPHVDAVVLTFADTQGRNALHRVLELSKRDWHALSLDNKDEQTFMHDVNFQNCEFIAKLLIDLLPEIDQRAIELIIENALARIFIYLVQKGLASPKCALPETKLTIIHTLIQSHQALHLPSNEMEPLLKLGCDANAIDNLGRTPLILACHVRSFAIADALLSQESIKIDVMVMDSTGRSALHYASEAVLLENNSSAADFVRKYLVRIPKDALLLSPDYRTNSGFILAYVLDRIRSFGPLKPRHQHTFGSLLTAPSFATASSVFSLKVATPVSSKKPSFTDFEMFGGEPSPSQQLSVALDDSM